MRTKLYLIFLMSVCSLLAFAVPAKRVKKVITLADGSRKEVVLRGDENVHFYQDDVEDACYEESADGGYERVEPQMINERWQAKLQARNALRAARLARRKSASVVSNGPLKAFGEGSFYTGQKKGLVLLVNFSDKKMLSSHSNAFYQRYFNETGFSDSGMAGSVHDYFYSCSYGQFDLTFDVAGPFQVSNTMAYYGKNDSAGDDKHPAEMVIEACRMADKSGVDFSQYDWDGDGYVDQVFVIYAGYAESQGGASNTIWPHEFELSSAASSGDGTGAFRLDGVMVNTYAVTSELNGSSGSVVAGIGTACHEFSHCLGIPDFYDTQYSAFGMNRWDLMDYGSYNGSSNDSGTCPAAFTSYERMYCGWLKPVELNDAFQVKDMQALEDEKEAYIVYNERFRDEYYLLENRQKRGFDACLPGHGMLVVHVDYNKKAWEANSVNTTASHPRMTIIPADNKLDKNSMAGDPWPGTMNRTSLTDLTSPAATLFNSNIDGRKFMGKPIERIAENAATGTISFRFNFQKLGKPSGLLTESVGEGTFNARWDAVPNATSYTLLLSEYEEVGNVGSTAVQMLLHEGFSKLDGTLSYNGSTDVYNKLDEVLETTGWKGSKVFVTSDHKLKLGSGSATGALYTPFMSVQSDKLTLLVEASAYSDKETAKLVIGVDWKEAGKSGYQSKRIETFTLSSDAKTYRCVIDLKDVERSSCRVSLSSDTEGKRLYLSGVSLYEGEPSEAELENGSSMGELLEMYEYTTTDPFLTLTNLPVGRIYTWEVCATNEEEDLYSEWSSIVTVPMPLPFLLGDVDGDGILTAHDVWGISQFILCGETKGLSFEAADMNKDGHVTIADIAILVGMF